MGLDRAQSNRIRTKYVSVSAGFGRLTLQKIYVWSVWSAPRVEIGAFMDGFRPTTAQCDCPVTVLPLPPTSGMVPNTPRIPTLTDAQPMLATDAFRQDTWVRQSPHLPNDSPALTSMWPLDAAFHADYGRYPALRLTPDELQAIDGVQLPVMRRYEREAHGTAVGRTVFAPSKGFAGLGGPRKGGEGDTSCPLRTPDGSRPLGRMDVGTSCRSQQPPPSDRRHLQPIAGVSVERQMVYVASFDKCFR